MTIGFVKVDLAVQFSNLSRVLPECLRQSASAPAHVVRLQKFTSKIVFQKESPPSLRNEASAGEVALPVQFSNIFLEDLKRLASLAA